MSCGSCASSVRTRARSRRSYSSPSVAAHSPRTHLTGWSKELDGRPSCRSRCTRTCCGTLPAINSLATVTTRARSRIISATRTSGIRCAIPSCHRSPSGTFGAIEMRGGPYGCGDIRLCKTCGVRVRMFEFCPTTIGAGRCRSRSSSPSS